MSVSLVVIARVILTDTHLRGGMTVLRDKSAPKCAIERRPRL